MSGLGWTLAAIALSALLWAASAACGTRRWRTATDALVARLEAARRPISPSHYDATRELDALPAPVQRYFRAALVDGTPIVVAATVEHEGSFDMGGASARWIPFTSRQRVLTRPPGFVWDGRMSLLPGLPVRVHDAYVAGEGVLHAAFLGLFAFLDLRGGAGSDVAHGELMRFFAEAAWYPTALLPSQGVRWQPIDEHCARATLSDGPIEVTLTFRFDAAEGLIERVRAEARGRTVGKQVVPTPWEGRWSNPRWQDGMRVPRTGEVAWLLPEGRKPYWRGTITALRYEFAR